MPKPKKPHKYVWGKGTVIVNGKLISGEWPTGNVLAMEIKLKGDDPIETAVKYEPLPPRDPSDGEMDKDEGRVNPKAKALS